MNAIYRAGIYVLHVFVVLPLPLHVSLSVPAGTVFVVMLAKCGFWLFDGDGVWSHFHVFFKLFLELLVFSVKNSCFLIKRMRSLHTRGKKGKIPS